MATPLGPNAMLRGPSHDSLAVCVASGFVFAKASPYEATFLQLTVRSLDPTPMAGEGAGVPMDISAADRLEFTFLPLEFRTEHTVGFSEQANLGIICGARFHGDVLVTAHEAIPFEVFATTLPQRGAASRSNSSAGVLRGPPLRESARRSFLDMYPWMDADDLSSARAAPARARQPPRPHEGERCDSADSASQSGSESDGASEADDIGGAAPAAGGVDGAPDPLDDEDPMDVAAAVAAERAEFDWDDGEFKSFYKIVRGGGHTFGEKGVLTDCVAGYARAWAKDWAKKYGWGTMKSYSFNLYGRYQADELAKEWVRRSEYFYLLFEGAQDEAFEYTQADIDAYGERLEFLEFMVGEGPGTRAFTAGLELRGKAPRLGPP